METCPFGLAGPFAIGPFHISTLSPKKKTKRKTRTRFELMFPEANEFVKIQRPDP